MRYHTLMRSPFTIALANAPMFGQASHAKCLATFSTAEDVWKATRNDLLATGIEPHRVDQFITWRAKQDPMSFVAAIEQRGIRLIGLDDPEYPELLKTIYDPPAYLFVKGGPLIGRSTVAMVGSRECTQYGLETAIRLAKALAHGGLSIVSGGANGIDQASHEGALAANGHTIAVLGSGLLGIDNTRHNGLLDRILASGGTIVTEFPLATPPFKSNFPIRNRIVSGMCRATIIVEAALPSGTMITAEAAAKENRDVCAIPGNISSTRSAGTNFLIKTGAHCITEAQDVFQLYGMNVAPNASATGTLPPGRSESEQALFAVLSAEPLHIDLAAERASLSTSAASIAATQLELLGVIRNVGGNRFVVTG
jgi:DNA processing protein